MNNECWADHATSSTRSVGIVRLRTTATEFNYEFVEKFCLVRCSTIQKIKLFLKTAVRTSNTTNEVDCNEKCYKYELEKLNIYQIRLR
jgi:hypothetical protein